MVELIEQSQMAVDQLDSVLGRASIEAVLRLSAEGIAGPPHPGKRGGAVGSADSRKEVIRFGDPTALPVAPMCCGIVSSNRTDLARAAYS